MIHLLRGLIPVLALVSGFFTFGRGLFAQNARPLQLGSWASGTIKNGSGEWFSIRSAESGFLTLETSGDLDTCLEVYDAGGSLLMEDDDGGKDSNALVEFSADPGVSYRILARGYDDSVNGPFRILAAFEAIPPDALRNTDRSRAQSLLPGNSAQVYLLRPSESRWFKTVIPFGGGQFTAYTQGNLDTLLLLYDSQGQLLMENDDYGDTSNARVSAAANAGAALFIELRSYDGITGRSVLHAEIREAPKPDSYENDNTPASAKDIAIGDVQQRNFTSPADEDWVRLRITQTGVYEILCAAYNYMDTYLELYDSNNQQIASDDDSGGDYNALISKELYPGTYYIKATTISSDDPLPDNRYTLKVSRH
jgi:hypothetical protein